LREYECIEVHTISTGDVYGKQASKNPYDAALIKHCTIYLIGVDGDWNWRGAGSSLRLWAV
jgi:hypothetical protein